MAPRLRPAAAPSRHACHMQQAQGDQERGPGLGYSSRGRQVRHDPHVIHVGSDLRRKPQPQIEKATSPFIAPRAVVLVFACGSVTAARQRSCVKSKRIRVSLREGILRNRRQQNACSSRAWRPVPAICPASLMPVALDHLDRGVA
jgi:hypothetical protein